MHRTSVDHVARDVECSCSRQSSRQRARRSFLKFRVPMVYPRDRHSGIADHFRYLLRLTTHQVSLSPNSGRERFECAFPCQRDRRSPSAPPDAASSLVSVRQARGAADRNRAGWPGSLDYVFRSKFVHRVPAKAPPSHGRYSYVDRPGRKASLLQVKAIAQNHRFVEGQSRFRTIPGDELIYSMLISALRVRRTKAPEHCRFRVFQFRNTELSLWSVLLALCLVR